MTTLRLTAAQAMVKWLSVQMTPEGDRFIEGVWGIFGHGNVAGLGEALHGIKDILPTWRGHNEQTMAHTAIAYAKVERQDFVPHTVTITHVYAYVKDNYSFSDAPGKASQYLGHWNKNGVIFSPATITVHLATYLRLLGARTELDYPIARSTTDNPYLDGTDAMLTLGDPLKAEDVFYPARNRDFRNWQSKHQQGGNIMVFSDLKLIRLAKPIKFAIPVEG